MAQTAKTQPNRLTPTPKALQKALEQSARQAQRLADAYGLVVPGVKRKESGKGSARASTPLHHKNGQIAS